MCLKKKKDIKKKTEISMRSASRLDDKEKKLVSKEMHAVYNEHMDKRKFEFKPANLEEIDILVKDIRDDDFIRKESIKKENHIAENTSTTPKKVSSNKSSRKNSTTKSYVSCNSRENIRIEDVALKTNSVISNIEEKIEINHMENHIEDYVKEVQEKQLDLSSECSMESTENKTVTTSHVSNEFETIIKSEVKSITREIVQTEIVENHLEQSEKTIEISNSNHIETLELSKELQEESMIRHSEHVIQNTKTIEEDNVYLGYHIPDNESECQNHISSENICKEHVNKSVDNLVENIEDTMNTVKHLVGEEKLNLSEDVNNNYDIEDHKNIDIESTTFEKENVQVKSIVDSTNIVNNTSIINSKETHIEKVHKENIITTTFYEEISENKEDRLSFSCADDENLYNSTNQLINNEKSFTSNVESIKQSNKNIGVVYHDEKIDISNIVSNNSLSKHSEICSDNKVINHSRTSSINSKNSKNIHSKKKNSVDCSSLSNVSTLSDDLIKRDASIISKQSKSKSYASIESKSKEFIDSSKTIKHSIIGNNIIHNSNDISLLYKPKRKAASIKSIESSLSYGFPTKRHIIDKQNYKEIKKITEFQIDNKMNFNHKYNGYYLMKPHMIQSVCKYTKGLKITIGGNQKKSVNDKKIILFGPKGSGKTTLINNYCNILYGVGRECNFRFVVNSPDEVEPTKNIVTYEFNNTILGYKFTIIDTPGFDSNLPSSETFSYKTLYDVYLKNYISKANRILIHGVSIVIRNEDDIWNSRFYRQISGIRRIFCGNYENKNLYPIVTNAKAFSKLNYFVENIQGIYDQNDVNNHFKSESKIRKQTLRRANWYTDVFRMTSNIYVKNFEGKRTLDKVYLFNETEAAFDRLINALHNNLPILLKKRQGNFETIHEC
uniref:G domain-containing protein n=1 Tax=Strongyloides papillosus TaxID=174720 RepID=A0A0N5BVR0_STREA